MLFNSLEFVIFFSIVLFIAHLLKNKNDLRKIFLLIASLIFYMWWKWQFGYLIGYLILLNFFLAKAIYRYKAGRNRKLLVSLAVLLNFVFLGFFKYYNFFIANINKLLAFLNISGLRHIELVLPIGISFFTFKATAYIIDVYRGKIVPARFLDTALFIAFFPQLLAGPISRADSLIPQFQKIRTILKENFISAFHLIFWGLFKKMVLADNLSPFVNEIFSNYRHYNWLTILLGAYAFTFQIYYDFSGYSDIAIGCGRMLGYNIPKNFNLPYLAKSFSDFWRSWHITLSSWLRDYLYIPLGGNRGGLGRTCINIMITMLLGGLWHGANWTFIIWGGLHGIYIVIQKVIERNFALPTHKFINIIKIIITFQIVSLTWIFFRAQSFSTAHKIFLSMFTLQSGNFYLGVGVALILIFGFLSHFAEYRYPVYQIFCAQPFFIRYFIYSLGAFLILFNRDAVSTQFIYFQF